MKMINYLFNTEHHQQMLREAEHERLVRVTRANSAAKTRYHWDFKRLSALWGWWKESPTPIQTTPTPIIHADQVPCNC